MSKQSTQQFLLGTAVKITTTLSVSGASSVTITVDDPTEAVMVNDVAMTQDTDTVYNYIYQSASTDTEGDYVITIKAVYGAYTSVSQETFTLVEQI